MNRINSDLANDLGNLVSRTTAMINQYFGGILPAAGDKEAVDGELVAMAENLHDNVKKAMDALDCPLALTEIFKVVQRANKYIDETTPKRPIRFSIVSVSTAKALPISKAQTNSAFCRRVRR